LGTSIALVIFLLWQWLIIGAIPKSILQETLMKGLPVTQALQTVTGRPYLFFIGQFFAFFALTTSLLGVCFSMVDFLSGVFDKWKLNRFLLTLLTFCPPIICVLWNPQLFDKALCLAGGVGEAILNGFVPIAFFLILQKKMNVQMNILAKFFFALLISFCVLVFFIEVHELLS
jgi:tyrosine-specific transport protein